MYHCSNLSLVQSDRFISNSLRDCEWCRLPVPRPGQVLGLVGTNGIGKSTALKVLAGKLKPNLGRFLVSEIKWLYCFLNHFSKAF